MAKKKTQTEVKVHTPVLIAAELISEHPSNSNSQDRATFKNLKDSMLEDGMDETIIVAPRTDGKPGYWVVSGNHRFRAGVELGITSFHCIVHEDWDNSVQQQKQLLKRNLLKGEIGQSAFTEAIKSIRAQTNEDLNTIREAIGMSDPEAFLKRFKEEEAQANGKADRISRDSSVTSKVKMVEDLEIIVSSILQEYGGTVPYSYIIFPTGGKNHLFVQSSPSLKKSIELVCERCVRDNMDINIVLAGLLAIGMANSNFKEKTLDKEGILEAAGTDGDGDL